MPLSDRDYMRRTPPPARRPVRFNMGGFTLNPIWVLIIVNFVFFIATSISDRAFLNLALYPVHFTDKPWTIVTGMFVHAGLWHILFNMLGLFFLGRMLMSFIGSNRFLLVYLIGGIFANVLFMLLNLSSNIPVVGASGCVYAIAGTLVVMFPKLRVALWGIVPMPLWVFVVVFLGILSLPPFVGTNIAWQAHIGGLVVGLIAGYFFRRRTRYIYYR